MKYTNSIGTIRGLATFFEKDDERNLEALAEAGIETIQLKAGGVPECMTEEKTEELLRKIEGKFRITSVWGVWAGGPRYWNFTHGPDTLGIVPEAYRGMRLENLKKVADYAARLGVHDMVTHAGFIPENPSDPQYSGVVAALKHLAEYCDMKGIHFDFETGQETPTTLMRTIQDMGCKNVGVNIDPANLIMYGRGNPVDALDLYGSRIRSVHIKDGDYPHDDFYKLGPERVVGEGSVNYPVFLPKLLKGGYKGDLYIEREISGPKKYEDIARTVQYVKKLMKEAEE